jgi:hypothetical protein
VVSGTSQPRFGNELHRRVPKGSPDGTPCCCFESVSAKGGIYVTNTTSSYRNYIAPGFGVDWSPTR